MSRLDGLLRRIEAMGVSGTERHWAIIPADLARRTRPRVIRVGDGLATLMAKADSLRMNRVTGVGHRGRAEESMVDAIIDVYRSARVRRFSWLLSPGPQVEAIAGWLEARGFAPHPGGHVLLVRNCRRPVPEADSSARVRRAVLGDADTIVRIGAEAFGTPRSRWSWSRAGVSQPGYEHYLATIGGRPAAMGALSVAGRLAWLGGGATRTRWRRRGAQGALIAARLRRALVLGCSWAWSETRRPVPGRPQASFRNLVRFGFEVACEKPAFVWKGR